LNVEQNKQTASRGSFPHVINASTNIPSPASMSATSMSDHETPPTGVLGVFLAVQHKYDVGVSCRCFISIDLAIVTTLTSYPPLPGSTNDHANTQAHGPGAFWVVKSEYDVCTDFRRRLCFNFTTVDTHTAYPLLNLNERVRKLPDKWSEGFLGRRRPLWPCRRLARSS